MTCNRQTVVCGGCEQTSEIPSTLALVVKHTQFALSFTVNWPRTYQLSWEHHPEWGFRHSVNGIYLNERSSWQLCGFGVPFIETLQNENWNFMSVLFFLILKVFMVIARAIYLSQSFRGDCLEKWSFSDCAQSLPGCVRPLVWAGLPGPGFLIARIRRGHVGRHPLRREHNAVRTWAVCVMVLGWMSDLLWPPSEGVHVEETRATPEAPWDSTSSLPICFQFTSFTINFQFSCIVQIFCCFWHQTRALPSEILGSESDNTLGCKRWKRWKNNMV